MKELYYLIDNNLISQNQSGFKRGGSCINQLIPITHNILNSLDEGLEVRDVFLDISKAFGKVWHEGLIYKLQQNGISGKLLNILNHFLNNRTQRVAVNGQSSNCVDVKAGVPQASIMGPLLFLTYINDIPEGFITNAKLFADDTSLFSIVRDIAESTGELNYNLRNISKWVYQWKIIFNPDLTKQAQEVIFSRKLSNPVHPKLTFNNSHVSQTESQKHIGLILDNKLNFNEHLKGVLDKISKTIGLVRKFQPIFPRFSLLTIYKTFVRPHLDYGDIIYYQNYKASFHSDFPLFSDHMYQQRHFIQKVKSRIRFGAYIPSNDRIYNTKNAAGVLRMKSRHTFLSILYFYTYIPSTIMEWNKLDQDIRNAESYVLFRQHLLSLIRPEANNRCY